MKISKKTAMLASFAVGALLFASTALADIATKSGYEQLKDGIKGTAEKCTNSFDSFTLDISYAVKDNEKTLSSHSQVEKYDRTKNASERFSETEIAYQGKYKNYYYSDKTGSISQNNSDETYYVTEFTTGTKPARTNPFKEPRVEDMERIADALVGSLKDNVVVTEKPDGSKDLSGSLTEVQIPPLVNAVTSFLIKQQFGGNNQQTPQLTKDLFVKSVKGKAVINKDGVMENILATVVLSGKDKQGQVHEVSVELLYKLTGINSTTVSKPDIKGKKVVKQVANKGREMSNPQKFVGKWKNDILIEKDGKYIKVGERFMEIAHMDNKTVAGRYYELYKPGFEQYATNKRDFTFDASFDNDPRNANFDYTTEAFGKQHGNFYFDDFAGKVRWNNYSQTAGNLFDPTFSPALD